MPLEYNTNRERLEVPHVGRIFAALVKYVDGLCIPEKQKTLFFRALVDMYVYMRYRNSIPDNARSHAWLVLSLVLKKVPKDCPEEISHEAISTVKPSKLAYPDRSADPHGFGKLIYRWIHEIEKIEDQTVRVIHATILANFLKHQIRKWQGRYPSDDLVKEYIQSLSRHTLTPDFSINIAKKQKS